MVEQPATIIPDSYQHPSQRLRPCEVGDGDNIKPIHLYERGGRALISKDPSAIGVSADTSDLEISRTLRIEAVGEALGHAFPSYLLL